jgi:serine protease Do
MKTRICLGCLLATLASAATVCAEEDAAPTAQELIERYDPFLVRVEYTLQYDRGQAPPVDWSQMQSAGSMSQYEDMDWTGLIDQERPAERVGYLVGPDLVVTEDIDLHPRFIKAIQVRVGDKLLDADRAAVLFQEDGVLLRLRKAVHDSGLTFDGDAEEASKYLRSLPYSGTWMTGIGSLDTTTWRLGDDWVSRGAPSTALILDKAGLPVGVSFGGALAGDGRWQGPPTDWPQYSEEELAWQLEQLSTIASAQVPHVELRLRSPKEDDSGSAYGRYRYGFGDEDEGMTQWDGPGVLLNNRLLLVLVSFKPSTTARLETIRVHLGPSEVKTASFVGSLKDYGALIAEFDEPIDIMPRLCETPIRDLGHELLLTMHLSIHGDSRVAYYQHERLEQFVFGWRRQVYPTLAASTGAGNPYYGYGYGSASNSAESLRYIFDRDMALAAIPLGQRAKVTVEDDYEMASRRLTPISYLTDLLTDLEEHLDANNVPLSEEEEERIAWLGVELQRLDPELARLNGITDISNDGSFGAFVTYVYADSPAAKAGLKMGDILLKLHVEGYPKPLEVYGTSVGRTQFPWDEYDGTPVEYLQELPTPWPNAESRLTLSLTQVGFGTPYELEYYRDGEILTEAMVVEQSPPFYGNAKRYKNEGLELTVRDLSYEVRRYFQRRADDPGVIISKVEAGSKADVAGLRPYEVILSVNDQPVHSVDEFEAAILGPDELRFEVRRMRRGRIVKIRLDEPLTAGAADEGETEG